MIDLTDIPLFVGFFFQYPDPVVRCPHGHPVIKTKSTRFQGGRQSGHAAHLFCNRDRVSMNFLYQFISQHQVAYCILILLPVKVHLVTCKIPGQAMIIIKHACDPVETETIETVFFKPVPAVGQQEVEYFVFAVIEAE